MSSAVIQGSRRRTVTKADDETIKAVTSRRMASVRQKDTSAELVVRRLLTELGHRYRVRNQDLPGSPDIANRHRRWLIYVHGCFWHRHIGCGRASTPKTNREFWDSKFTANLARDSRCQREARELGYCTIVIWECETANAQLLRKRLQRLLRRPRRSFASLG
jgi:DNA mismatch endonuclease (patch repair protein)